MAILGNIAMQGLTVTFDRQQHRIGFAQVRSTNPRIHVFNHHCPPHFKLFPSTFSLTLTLLHFFPLPSSMQANCPGTSGGPQVSVPSPTSPSLTIHPASLPPTAPTSDASSSALIAGTGNGLTHRWKSTRAEALPALLSLLAQDRARKAFSPPHLPHRRLTSLYCMLAGMGVSMLVFAVIHAVQTRRRRQYQPLHASSIDSIRSPADGPQSTFPQFATVRRV